MRGPVEVLDPVEIPGWGQIGYGYLEDAVTWGQYALAAGGAAYALKHHEAELQRLVDMNIWLSPAAYDLLTSPPQCQGFLNCCTDVCSQSGSTVTTNESALSAAFALTSQHPSVGKIRPAA